MGTNTRALVKTIRANSVVWILAVLVLLFVLVLLAGRFLVFRVPALVGALEHSGNFPAQEPEEQKGEEPANHAVDEKLDRVATLSQGKNETYRVVKAETGEGQD